MLKMESAELIACLSAISTDVASVMYATAPMQPLRRADDRRSQVGTTEGKLE
jgi:hypothetical protein